ncbi:MAG TPA: hypothetical protein VG605_16720 [Puia sp.]|nr:hypothetical protein [Puia sp.]
MARSQDIALEENDLLIDQGDLAISYSDEQHIADTMNAYPGWWKENPPDGVGLFSYTSSAGQEQALSRVLKLQLQSDGYQVANPQVKIDNSGKLNVNPNATKV